MPLTAKANIIGNPSKLCQLKNCYTNYKKIVLSNTENFLRHKHQQKLQKEEKMKTVVEECNKVMIEEKKQKRA